MKLAEALFMRSDMQKIWRKSFAWATLIPLNEYRYGRLRCAWHVTTAQIYKHFHIEKLDNDFYMRKYPC